MGGQEALVHHAPGALAEPATPSRWAAYGAAFGASATAAVTIGPILLAPSLGQAMLFLPAFGVATTVGAALGARWHGLVERDRHRLTVAGWLARFGSHGAVWGLLTAWAAILPFSTIHGVTWAMFLQVMGVGGLIGALASGATVGLLGLLHVLDLTRGRSPWRSLLLAVGVGPLFFVFFAVSVMFGVEFLFG